MNDIFSWAVEYTDGTRFSEADADAQGGAWGLVDTSRVRAILLATADHPPIIVMLPPDATPLFFRRRSILAETNEQLGSITCAGWRRGEQASYLWLWDNGQVALTDRDLADIG